MAALAMKIEVVVLCGRVSHIGVTNVVVYIPTSRSPM